MGEIIDLENYRRQRKRRLAETSNTANRRKRNRGRSERDRLRPAADAEPTETTPGNESAD